MTTEPTADDLRKLITDTRTAVTQARELSFAPRVWDFLNAANETGMYQPSPWTEEAIAGLDEGMEALHEDPGLLHHAAIAYHARAWQLELDGEPGAATAWTEALALWRQLHSSPQFWQTMRDKASRMKPPVEPEVVDGIRARVYDHLMAVHVAFVRHYCEQQEHERAETHIELVRGTRLPPAVRKQMPQLLFEAMTGSVGDLIARQHYPEAITVLERFLALHDDHMPALRRVLQICRDWVSPTSTREDWDLIWTISRRTRPWAERVSGHPGLASEPLASLDLISTCEAVGQRFRRKFDEIVDRKGNVTESVSPEHLEWIDHALFWLRIPAEKEPNRYTEIRLENILWYAARLHAAAGDVETALAEQEESQQIAARYSE
jgi:hypothetical protein